MRVPPVFNDKEGAILGAMYEAANGTYDTYTLARILNPAVSKGTPQDAVAFTETREATERLILQRLVSGQRLTGADGVYFRKLKLTVKGEQAAIQHRKQAELQKKAIADLAPLADKVAKEIDGHPTSKQK